MAETEKIRFMGYNQKGEKYDTTISGIYERSITEVETTLSTMDTLRYDYIFMKDDNGNDPMKKQKFKKIKLSLVTEGIFHDMQILMQGRAYVMNNEGTTIDTIKQEGQMVRTIKSPILGTPIVVIHQTPKQFIQYYKKNIDIKAEIQIDDTVAGYNGMVTLRQTRNGQFKLFLWLCDEGENIVANHETVFHESFHIVCRIRECMYGMSDKLVINSSNEEDWAYLVSEVAKLLFDCVDSMQKELDKRVNK